MPYDFTSTSGSRVPYFLRSSTTGDRVIGFKSDGTKLFVSSDSGTTLSDGTTAATAFSPNSTTISALAISSTGQYVILAPTGAYNCVRSTDYGATFSAIAGDLSSIPIIKAICSSSDGSKLVFFSNISGTFTVYISSDSGATVAAATNVVSGSTFVDLGLLWCQGMTAMSSDGNTVYASVGGLTGHIIKSTDAGDNWTELTNTTFGCDAIACSSNGNVIVIASNTGGVMKSINGGTTWSGTGAPTGSGQNYKSIACDSTGTYMIAGDYANGKTYVSTDSGASWTLKTTTGTNNNEFIEVSMSGNHLYAFTVGFSTGLFAAAYTVTCFKEDTKILCKINETEEYIPIQALRKGDLVKTSKDGYKAIHMVGQKKINHVAQAKKIPNQLYVCSKAKFPEATEDLIITGNHSILVDDIRDSQRKEIEEILGKIYVTDNKYRLPACLDERTEVYEKDGTFNIYHFSLENDNYYMNYGIYANGLLVETSSKRYLKEMSSMRLIE